MTFAFRMPVRPNPSRKCHLETSHPMNQIRQVTKEPELEAQVAWSIGEKSDSEANPDEDQRRSRV
jgi:hypothetical protein